MAYKENNCKKRTYHKNTVYFCTIYIWVLEFFSYGNVKHNHKIYNTHHQFGINVNIFLNARGKTTD
jgi:hypothetical protein